VVGDHRRAAAAVQDEKEKEGTGMNPRMIPL
jgi:hypothetical protein